jgi:hypothetical protein
MQCHRRVIAGTSTEALIKQQTHELTRLPDATCANIVNMTGQKKHVKIPADLVVAIKESLGLTWVQLNKLRRILKTVEVDLEHEGAERECMKEITGEWVKSKEIEFVFQGIRRGTEFTYIKELSEFVCDRLNQYKERGLLTWHNNAIPNDQIFIKVGGDSGKGSFKVSIEILNLDKPNSKTNTTVIAMATIKDKYENFEIFLNEIKS